MKNRLITLILTGLVAGSMFSSAALAEPPVNPDTHKSVRHEHRAEHRNMKHERKRERRHERHEHRRMEHEHPGKM